jgi:hypothetical protein
MPDEPLATGRTIRPYRECQFITRRSPFAEGAFRGADRAESESFRLATLVAVGTGLLAIKFSRYEVGGGP